jgi:hypothetical protein
MRLVIGLILLIGLPTFSYQTYAAEFHVAPDGNSAGDGSQESPWDLATAFSHPEAVNPGDTIWLHGGTYEGSFDSKLNGSEGNYITVKAHPGEWPVIDGKTSDTETFVLHGSWTIFQGFEITNSKTERMGGFPGGMHVLGPNLKLINLIMHDLGNNGFWTSALNMEMYGCLVYHNGYDDSDRGHGHGIYSQNLEGSKLYSDNIIFGGYSFGFHIYTEGGDIQGFDLIGNIWFNAGVVSTYSGHKDDCLVGGGQPAARIVLRDNMGWSKSPTTRNTQLGYYDVVNEDVTVQDNYIVGDIKYSGQWNSIVMTSNTIYSSVSGVNPADYPDNNYLSEAPTETKVFVRPNDYEAGRAHIVIYNWENTDYVNVNVSEVLNQDEAFEVRNAQNFFGQPVLSGTYTGDDLQLPLIGLEPAQPVGDPGEYEVDDHTGKAFNVFVLLKPVNGPGYQASGDDGGVVEDGGVVDDGGVIDDQNPNSDQDSTVVGSGCSCNVGTGSGFWLLIPLFLCLLLFCRRRLSSQE